MSTEIAGVAFDCFGTLIDFGDEAFARAFGQVCLEQSIELDGQAFYDKWMEIWRRMAQRRRGTFEAPPLVANEGVAEVAAAAVVGVGANEPGPLSEPEPHPEPQAAHRMATAERANNLDGEPPPFRPYSEEWPEHFDLVFEELGLKGDGRLAHSRLVEMMGAAPAFEEARRVVETISRHFPIACMSNSDDDFLRPPLARNGLVFPVVISSESAQAYKPHVSIFRNLSESMGLPPEKILYVGDSRPSDIAGGKNAGMSVAWVHRPSRRVRPPQNDADRPRPMDPRFLVEPDYEMETLDQLLDILDLR